MVNHGLSTGALFLIVGMIYERYHTREMGNIGGLGRKMPVMTFFLLVFTMSSIGLPGLNGFVGEFLVLLGTFTSTTPDSLGRAGSLGIWFAVPAATGILLGAIYMLHMVRAVVFGPVKEPGHGFDSSSGLSQDLTRREVGILAPIAAVCLLLGVYPKVMTNVMEPAVDGAVLARVFHTQDWRAAGDSSAGQVAGALQDSVESPESAIRDPEFAVASIGGARADQEVDHNAGTTLEAGGSNEGDRSD
jgi:NADH:ubiquinone oxidoreductase subunit 4 (subunit M)